MIYKLQSENPKNQLKVEKLMKTKTARAKNVLQTGVHFPLECEKFLQPLS